MPKCLFGTYDWCSCSHGLNVVAMLTMFQKLRYFINKVGRVVKVLKRDYVCESCVYVKNTLLLRIIKGLTLHWVPKNYVAYAF